MKALLAATLLLLMAACGPTPEPAAAVGPADLLRRIVAGTAPLILDVRTPAEFEAGHIAGAVNIPHDQLAHRTSELGISPADEVVVLCQSGRRAAAAQAVLREAGYTNVKDLTGHMQAWKQAALPVQ